MFLGGWGVFAVDMSKPLRVNDITVIFENILYCYKYIYLLLLLMFSYNSFMCITKDK